MAKMSFMLVMLVVTLTSANSIADQPKQVSLSIHATASDEGVEGTVEVTAAGINSNAENVTTGDESTGDGDHLEDGMSLSIQGKGSDEGVEGALEVTGAANSDSEDDTAEGSNIKDDQKLEDLSEEMVEFRREWKESNQDIVDQLQAIQATFNASTGSDGDNEGSCTNRTSSTDSAEMSQLEARIEARMEAREARIEALISKIENGFSTSSSNNHTRGGPTTWGKTCKQLNQSQSFSKICFETNAQNHTQGNDTIICGAKWKAPLQCGLGIGINSAGIITSGHLGQSSSVNGGYTAAQSGRLDDVRGWCPQHTQANEWISVSYFPETVIYGTIIQGIGNDEDIYPNLKDSYVKTYKVTYYTSGDEWLPVTDEAGDVMIFQGIVDDKDTAIAQKFPQPVTTTAVRIYVLTWHRYPCLRFELLTC